VSIGALLAVIGVVALDLSIGRAFLDRDGHYPLGLTLIGPVIQLGLIRVISHRGSSRPFWIGFVLSATAAAASFILFVEWPESDSLPTTAWYEYERFIDLNLIEIYEDGFKIHPVPDPPGIVLADFAGLAILLFLPQLFAGLSGGWIFFMVSRVRGFAVSVDRGQSAIEAGQPSVVRTESQTRREVAEGAAVSC
jgi:hypothetical protein